MRKYRLDYNLGAAADLCQWRRMVFAALLLAWFAVGCGGKHEVPPCDTLRSQLLIEACEALKSDDVDAAVAALGRLADIAPDDPFVHAIETRLRQHQVLVALNKALVAGDVEQARSLLEVPSGEAWRVTEAAAPAVEALEALRTYVRQRPFSTSREARQALLALQPYVAVLQKTPAGAAFLRGERQALRKLVERERDLAIKALVESLDLAAVGGGPYEVRLAHLLALDATHPLVQAWQVGLAGGKTASARCRAGLVDEGLQRAYEIGLCLANRRLEPEDGMLLPLDLCRTRPASLSGYRLRAAAFAEAREWPEAIQNFRELVSVVVPSREFLARMLRRYVVPPRQARAWAWQTPCPGVPELLARIAQLEINQAGASRPRRQEVSKP